MSNPLTDLRRSIEEAGRWLGFRAQIPPELPDWIETEPIRTAVNRITGERIFLDPQTKMWRYLPESKK